MKKILILLVINFCSYNINAAPVFNFTSYLKKISSGVVQYINTHPCSGYKKKSIIDDPDSGDIKFIGDSSGSVVGVPARGILATLAGIETLSNKTLVSPRIIGDIKIHNGLVVSKGLKVNSGGAEICGGLDIDAGNLSLGAGSIYLCAGGINACGNSIFKGNADINVDGNMTTNIGGGFSTTNLSGNVNICTTGAGSLIMGNGPGSITIGSNQQSAPIILGQSNTTNSINIGNGFGKTNINIGNGNNGNTISIGNGDNSISQTINIANGNSVNNSTVNIFSGNIIDGIQQLKIFSGVSSGGLQKVDIFDNSTATNQIFNLGNNAGISTINIGTGHAPHNINIGSSLGVPATTILGAVNINPVGSSSTLIGNEQSDRVSISSGGTTNIEGLSSVNINTSNNSPVLIGNSSSGSIYLNGSAASLNAPTININAISGGSVNIATNSNSGLVNIGRSSSVVQVLSKLTVADKLTISAGGMAVNSGGISVAEDGISINSGGLRVSGGGANIQGDISLCTSGGNIGIGSADNTINIYGNMVANKNILLNSTPICNAVGSNYINGSLSSLDFVKIESGRKVSKGGSLYISFASSYAEIPNVIAMTDSNIRFAYLSSISESDCNINTSDGGDATIYWMAIGRGI